MADGSQGLRGIIELFLLGRVENRDRRQGAFDRTVDKQRGLFLFLHALARQRRLDRCRGDHRRNVFFTLGHVPAQGLLALDQAFLGLGLLTLVGGTRGDHFLDPGIDLTQLRHQLLALGTRRPPAIQRALEQLEEVESDLAGNVHHLEPRQVGKDRQTEQEQGNEQQRAALDIQGIAGQVAKAFAQRTAGTGRQAGGRMKMDMRQRGTGQY